jgi:lambda family phage portal protein
VTPTLIQKPRYRVPALSSPVELPARAAPRSQYLNGGHNPVFRLGPRAPLRDARDDVRAAWTDVTARMVDMIHNSGWIAGMIDQAVASTVGNGLRVSSKPDAEALGISTQDAAQLGRIFERRFEGWSECAYDCDIEGRDTFGKKQAQGLKSWFAAGEIVGEIPWKRRVGGSYGTKVRNVSPHRVVQTTNEAERLFQGVRLDADGMPIGYRVCRKDPMLGDREFDIPARDRQGRALTMHVFDGMAGQVRGITPMVPALKVARRFDQLSDATLTAAVIQSLFAATIKSDTPTDEMIRALTTPQEQVKAAAMGSSPYDAYFDAQQGWYDATNIDLGLPGRIAHLFPGQEMNFLSSAQPNANFKDYAMFLLRELARCCGVTFEDATGDYTGATYSSVRMATSSIFPITLYRRKNIVAPFCQPVFEAVIEEDIEAGRIEVPGGFYNFLQNRTAFCRAEWKGTAKPQADDLKLAKAHETWRNMGVISDEMIASDLGVDIEDVYEARQREKEMRKEFGLEEPKPKTALTQQQQAEEDELLEEDDEKVPSNG